MPGQPDEPCADMHVLPEPVSCSPDEPFVGNESVDDNIAEAVRVALWNATRGHRHGISVEVSDRLVSLAGNVTDEDESRRCEAAVEAVSGVLGVRNQLRWQRPFPGSDLA